MLSHDPCCNLLKIVVSFQFDFGLAGPYQKGNGIGCCFPTLLPLFPTTRVLLHLCCTYVDVTC